jgi:tetratricopeptide (TPR) repeat protein
MVNKFFTDRIRFVLYLSVVALLLNACALPESLEYRYDRKLGLEEAVALLGQDLKTQLEEAPQKEKGATRSTQSIVVDPILSIENGQQFKANQQIESILTRELGSAFKVEEISPETLAKAGYVLTGALSQSANLSRDTQSNSQLVIAILELSTGTVKAIGRIGINGYPSEPLSFYKDSPLFLRDKSVRLATLLFSWSRGQAASPEYIRFLPEKANIQKGIISYDKGQFSDAASSFSKAVEHSDGGTLSSYAGLYLSSQKLHRNRTAYKAFTNLLTIAIDENHRLDLRLQFRDNSPAFVPEPELAKQYAGWLKYIARYMQRNRYCLDISGHGSRSEDKMNAEQLSLSRARTIQGVMSVTYPGIIKKSRVEGKGFKENIVGNGANDASDAADRRVELSVINCSEL